MKLQVELVDSKSLKNGRTCLEIRVVGDVLLGSAGNSDIGEIRNQILKIIELLDPLKTVVILNFSTLNYTFGDSIASLWMTLMTDDFEVCIVAEGNTYKSIGSLIRITLPVPIFQSVPECLVYCERSR